MIDEINSKREFNKTYNILYEVCSKCGCFIKNNRCVNKECKYHWIPIENKNSMEKVKKKKR